MSVRNVLPGLLAAALAVGTLQAQAAQEKPAQPVDVAGVWEMTTQSPQGDMTADATFVRDGDKIKFTATGPGGFEMTGEGTIKGQDLEWSVTISTPQGEFVLVYKAKIDGAAMSGEVQAGDFGAFPFTAKKKQ